MTRDVSTIICVKRRGVGVNWTWRECGEAQAREMEDGEDPQWYSTAGGQIQGGREAGFEDDGDRGRWIVGESRTSARQGFKGTRT